jgi:nitroreductase
MNLLETILTRRSIRDYESKPILRESLQKILEAGRMAPSAMNKQPWHFIVVTDDELKAELSNGLMRRFIKKAPITIIGCAHQDRIGGRWSKISTAIALQNMVIAAWSLGIGSCWIGAFNEEKVKRLLAIPKKWDVVALIPFGYPAKIPQPKRKKPVEKISSYNKFSGMEHYDAF